MLNEKIYIMCLVELYLVSYYYYVIIVILIIYNIKVIDIKRRIF